MSKLFTKLSATAIALVVAMPLAAQDTLNADTVVATVGGTEITLGNMLMVRAGLPEQYQQLPNEVLWDGILDQLVQQTALSQSPDAAETKRVKVALQNERRALLASEVIAKIAETAVTEEAIKAAYDAKFAGAEMGTEYNAAHILVETEEEAAALVQELKDGADFGELAKEKSTGPSGPNGGSLGWFGAGMMVEPFQKAVETMEPGAVSDPVQTQFGWHVIKLIETRTQDAPSFESQRDELMADLQNTAVSDAIDAVVAGSDVTRTAKEDIDVDVLNQLNLLED